jgi:O-methyltransferase
MIRKLLRSVKFGLVKLITLLLKIISPSQVVIQGPVTFSEDGLTTRANADFLHNDRFMSSYAAGKATQSWGRDIRWRAYVVAWAANKGASLEGDFVECGVNRGGSAMVAASYVNFGKLNKTFYLLDTYKGLDNQYVTDDEKMKGAPVEGRYIECYEDVKETFKDFSNVKLIRGSVPETLSQVDSKKSVILRLT